MSDESTKAFKFELDDLPLRACVEGFAREVKIMNSRLAMAIGRIDHLEGDQGMLQELLLKHGDHTTDCEYPTTQIDTGRVLADSEEELCDCGWCETKRMLEKRAEEE